MATATEYATAEDFATWRRKAVTMTISELRYAAKDCREAEAAMRGWNPIKEGYYSDQAATYGDELRRRRLAAG
jgi:hypothetical protein